MHAPYSIATINVKKDRFLHANFAMVKLLGDNSEAEVLVLNPVALPQRCIAEQLQR